MPWHDRTGSLLLFVGLFVAASHERTGNLNLTVGTSSLGVRLGR